MRSEFLFHKNSRCGVWRNIRVSQCCKWRIRALPVLRSKTVLVMAQHPCCAGWEWGLALLAGSRVCLCLLAPSAGSPHSPHTRQGRREPVAAHGRAATSRIESLRKQTLSARMRLLLRKTDSAYCTRDAQRAGIPPPCPEPTPTTTPYSFPHQRVLFWL